MSLNIEITEHSFLTIGGLLRWATTSLSEAGILSGRLDAEVLLASTLGIHRTDLILRLEDPVSPDLLEDFMRKIKRRAGHEPVSYITGMKEFWSLPFKVGPGVLIPRPETEILAETVVRYLRDNPPLPPLRLRGASRKTWAGRPKANCALFPDARSVTELAEGELRILDIGTGSGNIAVALAREFPDIQITAVDISEEALNYARENSRDNGVEEKIHFIREDFLMLHASRFTLNDFIVSNPPYIASTKIRELDPTISEFEPVLALDGGEEGLDFFRLLAKKSSLLLKPGGILAVEIGEEQEDAVTKIFQDNDLRKVKVVMDYAGLSRVVVASTPSL